MWEVWYRLKDAGVDICLEIKANNVSKLSDDELIVDGSQIRIWSASTIQSIEKVSDSTAACGSNRT